jgi:uncharacterized protein (TIGR02118 family)
VRKVMALLAGAPDEVPPGRCGLDVAIEGDGAVLSIWLDDGERVPVLPEGTQAWVVDERVQWPGDGRAGVKQVSFVRRLPSLTRPAFAAHWSERHTPLARVHHPAITRYVQNVVVDRVTDGSDDIDGIAELSFASLEDLRGRFYDSENGRAVIAEDVRRFIDLSAGRRLVADEVALAGR